MEKPGIEPATPGLQGIALIHYTMGAFHAIFRKSSMYRCVLFYQAIYFILLCF